ncbi:MAG: SDR family oxidoreductase [Actinomycetota bacterium]|nr:SDR family oxidoreductase [Actinomycetota bacterium]
MAQKDKGAVMVTGASTGIGRAIVLHLDRQGHTVFAGVRKQKDADNLVKAATTGNLTPVTIDVTEPATISSAREQIEGLVGRKGLAGLVNNAGVAHAGPVEHLPVKDFQRVIDINLTGQYAVTQEFLPLIRRATGTVVFITSIGGRVAAPFMSPYHASKFGVEGLADSLRREVKPWGINVVVVEPGSIATPIWEKGTAASEGTEFGAEGRRLYGKQLEAMKRALLDTADRGIEPEKVAEVVETALRKRRPKTRYIVGTDAKMMKRVSGLVGDRNFDTLMRRSMKLPDDAPEAR